METCTPRSPPFTTTASRMSPTRAVTFPSASFSSSVSMSPSARPLPRSRKVTSSPTWMILPATFSPALKRRRAWEEPPVEASRSAKEPSSSTCASGHGRRLTGRERRGRGVGAQRVVLARAVPVAARTVTRRTAAPRSLAGRTAGGRTAGWRTAAGGTAARGKGAGWAAARRAGDGRRGPGAGRLLLVGQPLPERALVARRGGRRRPARSARSRAARSACPGGGGFRCTLRITTGPEGFFSSVIGPGTHSTREMAGKPGDGRARVTPPGESARRGP